MSSCFSRCLRVPIAIRAFYESWLWIPQTLLLTHPDLHPGLLGLIQSLYSAHKDNQMFLHSRFGLGGDVLEPYKKIIDRWLWPDVLRNQDISISQAKRAISDYKKAVGDPEGVAELMLFYCEQAAGFCSDICTDDEGYFDALVRMFEQTLKFANALSVDRRDDLVSRLDRVRTISHKFGYGVGDEMDFLLSKYTRGVAADGS
jgi:hypothetical protein